PGVPVLIGSSRFAAGELASSEFDPDLFLLDDGFQHEALAREVDLALWDVRDMPNRMRQLPAGRLREGLGALRRATAIILTHAEYIPADGREDRIRRIIEQIKLHAPGARILDALTELAGYRNLASADEWSGLPQFAYRPMSELAGKRAILVSGLARADGFEQMVRDARIEVSGHLSFRDHARYDARTLDSIREALKSSGAELALTTEKDAVKFEAMNIGEYDVPICAIGLRMSLRQASDWNLILEETLRSVHKRGEDKD
ncbi:tetraacyldisaccharide 4'-kinase, partial [Candidatus Sumerlaeota bacterium]|nr:tetraacyldisaccharide 4'-kinase [Candidatus Sumerlaeota bacterium]